MTDPVTQASGGMDDWDILITCEHGGNEVPPEYAASFASPGAQADLRSHRGYDPGALVAAEYLTHHFGCRLIASTTTRLLVDLNRSESNPGIWSRYCGDLDEPAKNHLLSRYYWPYRGEVLGYVDSLVGAGRSVIHLSVHTFTKRFKGNRRSVDLGILFDPDRPSEREWSNRCRQQLGQRLPATKTRMNQPYAGIEDGLTTWMRTKFDERQYVGIEIELANTIAKLKPSSRTRRLAALAESIRWAQQGQC